MSNNQTSDDLLSSQQFLQRNTATSYPHDINGTPFPPIVHIQQYSDKNEMNSPSPQQVTPFPGPYPAHLLTATPEEPQFNYHVMHGIHGIPTQTPHVPQGSTMTGARQQHHHQQQQQPAPAAPQSGGCFTPKPKTFGNTRQQPPPVHGARQAQSARPHAYHDSISYMEHNPLLKPPTGLTAMNQNAMEGLTYESHIHSRATAASRGGSIIVMAPPTQRSSLSALSHRSSGGLSALTPSGFVGRQIVITPRMSPPLDALNSITSPLMLAHTGSTVSSSGVVGVAGKTGAPRQYTFTIASRAKDGGYSGILKPSDRPASLPTLPRSTTSGGKMCDGHFTLLVQDPSTVNHHHNHNQDTQHKSTQDDQNENGNDHNATNTTNTGIADNGMSMDEYHHQNTQDSSDNTTVDTCTIIPPPRTTTTTTTTATATGPTGRSRRSISWTQSLEAGTSSQITGGTRLLAQGEHQSTGGTPIKPGRYRIFDSISSSASEGGSQLPSQLSNHLSQSQSQIHDQMQDTTQRQQQQQQQQQQRQQQQQPITQHDNQPVPGFDFNHLDGKTINDLPTAQSGSLLPLSSSSSSSLNDQNLHKSMADADDPHLSNAQAQSSPDMQPIVPLLPLPIRSHHPSSSYGMASSSSSSSSTAAHQTHPSLVDTVRADQVVSLLFPSTNTTPGTVAMVPRPGTCHSGDLPPLTIVDPIASSSSSSSSSDEHSPAGGREDNRLIVAIRAPMQMTTPLTRALPVPMTTTATHHHQNTSAFVFPKKRKRTQPACETSAAIPNR